MAKRIAFACIEYVYDFTTKEDAENFVSENQGKGWWFEPANRGQYPEEYVYKNGGDDYSWTVVVRKPYGKYNPGW